MVTKVSTPKERKLQLCVAGESTTKPPIVRSLVGMNGQGTGQWILIRSLITVIYRYLPLFSYGVLQLLRLRLQTFEIKCIWTNWPKGITSDETWDLFLIRRPDCATRRLGCYPREYNHLPSPTQPLSFWLA